MTTSAFQIPSWFEVRFVDKPVGCERPHTHSSLIISAASGGYISLQLNEDEIRLKREMVVIIEPNTLHCVQSYSYNFKGVYVLEIFDVPSLEESRTSCLQMFNNQWVSDNQFYENFINLCQQLLSSLEETQKIELFCKWGKALRDVRYASNIEESARDYDVAHRIRKMLDAHEGDVPPFSEISRICGLSNEQCNRTFRSAYNISIQSYLLNKKAVRARTLLASSWPLSDIALACGFYDQNHFNRVFMKIFQISPTKYRALIDKVCQSHTREW